MRIEVLEEQQFAAVVAEHIVELARERSKLRVCVASGGTPRPVYAELGKAAQHGRLDASKLELTLLDEYGGLEPDDPGRCAAMLERDLLEPLGLALRDVERFDPDAFDPGAELERFRAAVQDGFDLCILGVGLNGHLGMNEPGSAEDAATRRVELHPSTQASSSGYGVRQTPTWGVTVGLRELLASSEVWLLATGAHKAPIIAQALEGEVTEEVPASLLQRHPSSTVWLDEAAAGALTGRSS
jgi:galactosamine-6-phosphate isomerase